VSGVGSGPTSPAVNNSNDPPKVEDPTKIPVIEVPRDRGPAPGGPFPQGDQTSGLDDAADQNAVIFLMEEYLVNFEKAVMMGRSSIFHICSIQKVSCTRSKSIMC
jgi:hypothetical protein